MALAARLELRQGQGLVITPQLQQAIKLLQLSNVELEAFVDAELERNPLLQREDGDGPALDEGPASDDGAAEASFSDGEAEPSDAAKAGEMDVAASDLYDASPGERLSGEAADVAAPSTGRGRGRAAPSTAWTTWRAG